MLARETAKPFLRNRTVKGGRREVGASRALSLLTAGGWGGLLNSRHSSKMFCAIIRSLVGLWGFSMSYKSNSND